MIDRYALAESWPTIRDYFKLGSGDYAVPPKYNISPLQKVPMIIADNDGNRRAGGGSWGILPRAWGTSTSSYPPINIRSEGLRTNAAYAKLLQRKRCIIPVTGYYQKRSSDNKIFHIKLESKPVFGIAGLYESFIHQETQERITTFAMIVTETPSTLKHLGQLAPAILAKVDERFWLDRSEKNIDNLLTVIQPYSNDDIIAYPVKDLILNIANDSPECLEPIG